LGNSFDPANLAAYWPALAAVIVSGLELAYYLYWEHKFIANADKLHWPLFLYCVNAHK
jgi:hypothetical protein